MDSSSRMPRAKKKNTKSPAAPAVHSARLATAKPPPRAPAMAMEPRFDSSMESRFDPRVPTPLRKVSPPPAPLPLFPIRSFVRFL